MSESWQEALVGFEAQEEIHLGIPKTVYRIGASGPSVVVCHEIPGITPKVAEFARHVADAGFRVSLPTLVGDPGRPPTMPYALKSLTKVCISREFSIFTGGLSSPVTDWLRSFGKAEHERCGGKGIGVVGMCFSGGFALALAVDPHVLAPVLSQPSAPIKAPLRPSVKRAIDVSEPDLEIIRTRMNEDPELCVLAYRFSKDPFVPEDRFAYLRERLGDRFLGVTFDSSPGNPDGYPKSAHSVLTEHLVPSARQEVIDLFCRQLA